MARRWTSTASVLGLVASWLLVTAVPAAAACHVAAFVEGDVEASASTGVVSLVVELQGRVGSCAGTVDVATADGTATAGEDYEAVTKTLTFEENDDRVETVDVTILADASDGESFTLELSNPTGSISGTGGPATVTIAGGAGAADDGAKDQATIEDDASEAEADSEADPSAEEGGANLVIVVVVVALLLGGLAFALQRRQG